jgi:hypothetical protein
LCSQITFFKVDGTENCAHSLIKPLTAEQQASESAISKLKWNPRPFCHEEECGKLLSSPHRHFIGCLSFVVRLRDIVYQFPQNWHLLLIALP